MPALLYLSLLCHWCVQREVLPTFTAYCQSPFSSFPDC